MGSSNQEPDTAPESDRWYNISLGSSFKTHHKPPPPKFCTLRYKFKPASVDKSQPGSLHKGKDNKVTVEYKNNQQGKPNVIFEGVSEDYKENDAVLFFDGETFRLERLHRAVKRLRHVRLIGESAAAAATTATATLVVPPPPPPEMHASPVGVGANLQSADKEIAQEMPAQTEQIGTDDVAQPEHFGMDDMEALECKVDQSVDHQFVPSDPPTAEAELNNVDALNDDSIGGETANRESVSGKGSRPCLDIDINLPHQADTDDEIADVDISDEETDKGPNAAEALRAQVNAEGRKEQSSSSSRSSSSGSDSDTSDSESGSGTESSSSGSDSSDGDSIVSI
ncbi:hypothetical protein Tsubulata_003977 [Turnera subulata]|uniref:Transcription elongation factor Eaf N-terminal domain-containing protein n=1 Tax=Turnera subulata TaxID=218843 RepID=A0A9Q0JMW4_9ROSI|nr:hypothetical protein Tsubulata_003977 [Turnera subulata]